MLDKKEVARLTGRMLQPYELPDDCPYLSEDQRELCKLTPSQRMEWWWEWLKMNPPQEQADSYE